MAINSRVLIARNHFEEMGVSLQDSSKTWKQASDRFDRSCTICCMHNNRASDCDACPIREAFLANQGWLGKPGDYQWEIQKELTLA